MIIKLENKLKRQLKTEKLSHREEDKLKLRRFLSYFEKNGEDLIFELELKEMDLELLKKIFKVKGDNPMYDSFEVYEFEANELEKIIKVKIDIEKYDVFLDCSKIK